MKNPWNKFVKVRPTDNVKAPTASFSISLSMFIDGKLYFGRFQSDNYPNLTNK